MPLNQITMCISVTYGGLNVGLIHSIHIKNDDKYLNVKSYMCCIINDDTTSTKYNTLLYG